MGGLTKVSFYNHHLSYALTWFALALMSLAAGVYLLREERRARGPHPLGMTAPPARARSGRIASPP